MKIFWFDTETSGVDPERHGIIQLAYIIEIDGVEKERGVLYNNCSGKDITEGALRINGFTHSQIAGFPLDKEMHKTLLKVFNKYVSPYDSNDKFIMGGYNVKFDENFLRVLWRDCGDKFFGSWFAFGHIDPSQIIRFLQYCGYNFGIGAKLTDLASQFGVLRENAHDAMVDVEMTIDVVRHLQKILCTRIVKRIPA